MFKGYTIIILIATFLLLFSCKSSLNEPKLQGSPFISSSSKTFELSSWAIGPRQRIESWVKEVTDSTSTGFIPVADRIAVFDNDGTLWPEQLLPTQAVFAVEYLKAIAPQHPEFQKDPVLKGILHGDMELMKKEGSRGILKLLNATHNGQTEETFKTAVLQWIDSARDKKFKKLYKEVIYLPMVELLDYLRSNGFKTFFVSGGADFMRVWSEEAYGIPPYQVIGSYETALVEAKEKNWLVVDMARDWNKVFAFEK